MVDAVATEGWSVPVFALAVEATTMVLKAALVFVSALEVESEVELLLEDLPESTLVVRT